jgi:hypothetical protein
MLFLPQEKRNNKGKRQTMVLRNIRQRPPKNLVSQIGKTSIPGSFQPVIGGVATTTSPLALPGLFKNKTKNGLCKQSRCSTAFNSRGIAGLLHSYYVY